jgi:hypothetical protein
MSRAAGLKAAAAGDHRLCESARGTPFPRASRWAPAGQRAIAAGLNRHGPAREAGGHCRFDLRSVEQDAGQQPLAILIERILPLRLVAAAARQQPVFRGVDAAARDWHHVIDRRGLTSSRAWRHSDRISAPADRSPCNFAKLARAPRAHDTGTIATRPPSRGAVLRAFSRSSVQSTHRKPWSGSTTRKLFDPFMAARSRRAPPSDVGPDWPKPVAWLSPAVPASTAAPTEVERRCWRAGRPANRPLRP